MIRGTKNEGISSLSKQRHANLGLTGTGIKGQSYVLVQDSITNAVEEVRDEFDDHTVTRSTFPSGEFNGTYE
jgi:hypothetical protein